MWKIKQIHVMIYIVIIIFAYEMRIYCGCFYGNSFMGAMIFVLKFSYKHDFEHGNFVP